jgi:hypothetical protein
MFAAGVKTMRFWLAILATSLLACGEEVEPSRIEVAQLQKRQAAPAAPPRDPDVHSSFVEGPNQDLAQGWFYQDMNTGAWCAFDDLNAAGRHLRSVLAEDGTRHQGWIWLNGGRLVAITELHFSEDAYAEDRYTFDGLKIDGMTRTGRYINAPQATYPYRPDTSGKLVLTEAARRTVDELTANNEETYIVDWPTNRRIEDFPFFSLLSIEGEKVAVRPGCTPVTGPVKP